MSDAGAGQRLTLVMMPFLGGSRLEWDEVAELLEPRFRCVGLDLPGFGDAANVVGYPVAEMAEYVAGEVRGLGLERFVLVGHSMAGKVSMVAAATKALKGLEGLVLVASSPPAPEPMNESRRAEMIAALGAGAEKSATERRQVAEKFIEANVDGVLPPEVFERAVADVLRMNPSAWTAWLESGSKEDWAERVGVLPLPALVVAGGADKDLGEDAQRKLVLPHFTRAKFAVVTGAAHLIPMERPQGLAKLIAEFADGLEAERGIAEYRALIASDRVSEATRTVLVERIEADDEPKLFTDDEMDTLCAVVECVVPQGEHAIDLGGALDRQLAGQGKGWRYDELPEGLTAYREALKALEAYAQSELGDAFVDLSREDQVEVLTRVQRGEVAGGELSAAQMQRWFEDCRADLTGLYVAHPDTMARMGYSGIADGADAARLSGFVQLGLGVVEAWEPKAVEVGHES